MAGPLSGLRVIEFAGLGPGPFCAMMLADAGAEVLRLDRLATNNLAGNDATAVMHRNRRWSIAMDLKADAGRDAALNLIAGADAIIEGFRPGVMERLGLGPEAALARNPKLIYGRMTGWGQTGPWAETAGHDIDYIAITGALHAIGEKGGGPVPPLNLVGDFGGGGMLLAFGITAALLSARETGRGQVVDAAMTEGAALLMASTYGYRARGTMSAERGSNMLDGGAHFYGTYECADGGWMAVGAIEPQFYALLLEKTGVGGPGFDNQWNRDNWPNCKATLAAAFKSKSRDAWCAIFDGSDACVAPVLEMDEAADHPHNKARGSLIDIAGVTQPAPAPRFAATPADTPQPPRPHGADTERALRDWGLDDDAIATLRRDNAIT